VHNVSRGPCAVAELLVDEHCYLCVLPENVSMLVGHVTG